MVAKLMIYGAYGYTGRLIAAQAIAQGHEVILSGRDPEKLGKVAKDLSAPQVAFELTDGPAMRAALGAVGIVINAAGPFTHTSKPMLDACLDTGTHYLDITGEVGVLAAGAANNHVTGNWIGVDVNGTTGLVGNSGDLPLRAIGGAIGPPRVSQQCSPGVTCTRESKRLAHSRLRGSWSNHLEMIWP